MNITKIAHLKAHTAGVYALTKSSDATFYSAGSDKIVLKWNLSDLDNPTLVCRVPNIIYALVFVKEFNWLIVGQYGGGVHIIDLTKNEEIKYLQLEKQPIFSINYSFEKNLLVIACGEGLAYFYQLDNLQFIKKIVLCKEKLRQVNFNENNAVIACGDGFLRFVNCENLTIEKEIRVGESSVNAVNFESKEIYISGEKDALLKIFSAYSNELLQNIPAHNYALYQIAFNSDKSVFATASRDKTIKLWNAENFELIVRINKENYDGHLNSVNNLLWMNDKLISCSDDRSIIVWKIEA